MSCFRYKRIKAFTLIELLIYMALSTVMVVVVSGTSIGMLRASQKTHLLQDVSYNSSFIFRTLNRLAQTAYAIDVPTALATSSSVTFRMYDAALDPTVVSYIDGVLYLTEGLDAPQKLQIDRVDTTLIFTNITSDNGSDSVDVYMQVSANTASVLASSQVSEEYKTTITLNHTP